jgi:hypothetical protein
LECVRVYKHNLRCIDKLVHTEEQKPFNKKKISFYLRISMSLRMCGINTTLRPTKIILVRIIRRGTIVYLSFKLTILTYTKLETIIKTIVNAKFNRIWMSKTLETQNQKCYNDIDSKYHDFDYQSCVGALLYLSGGTWYNISYTGNKLAKNTGNPGMKHYNGIMYLLGYLNNYPQLGIQFYNNL